MSIDTQVYPVVSTSGGFHVPENPNFARGDAWKPRVMLCGRTLTPVNYFESTEAANRHTGGRLKEKMCKQCERSTPATREGQK